MLSFPSTLKNVFQFASDSCIGSYPLSCSSTSTRPIGSPNSSETIVDYTRLGDQLDALLSSEEPWYTGASNCAALLWQVIPRINWVGFYLVESDNALHLGPFQGKPACTLIPKGKGVCGRGWEENKTQWVRNVHLFPGHIACDEASRSEVVVPIHQKGQVVAVLDVDSPELDRFSQEDVQGLEALVQILEKKLNT